MEMNRRAFLRRVAAAAGGVGALMMARSVGAPSSSTVVSDYLLLTGVGADPSVTDGAIWYRSDLGRLRAMPPSLVPKSIAFTDDAPGAHTHSHDTELTDVSANDHHAQLHAAAHHSGGGDVLALGSIAGTISDAQHGVRTLANAHKFTDLDFTSSNLTSLATKRHTDLSNLGLDEHTQYVLRSILTTKGDLFVRDASAISRLALGTDGFVLTADSTQTLGVKWAAAGAGSAREFIRLMVALRTYTNLGAGPVESSTADRAVVDLTNYTNVRLLASVVVAGVTGLVKAQYSTNNGGAWSDLSTTIALGTTGTKASASQAIPAGAKALILTRIVAVSGNGTEDPQVNAAVIEVS